MKRNGRPTREEFIELCKQCKNADELALRLKKSRVTVFRYAREFELKLSDLFKKTSESELPSELIERFINELETPVEDLLQEFNISRGTFYNKLPANIRRLRRTPDSLELRQQIIIAYIQEPSIAQLSKKLSILDTRISQILKEEGFNIPQGGTALYLADHLRGRYDRPIPKGLLTLLHGELLGDSSLECKNDPMGTKCQLTLKKYKIVVETPNQLLKGIEANTLTLSEAIQRHNGVMDTLSDAQTASFRLSMYFLAEPWVRFVAQRLRQYGYLVAVSSPKKRYGGFSGNKGYFSLTLISHKTFQLYLLFQQWYSNKQKHIADNVMITPDALLHLHVGDGSLSKSQITLNTQSLGFSGNQFLAYHILQATGISATVAPRKNQKGEIQYILRITKGDQINQFLAYLKESTSDAYFLAKQLVPWKFDCDLKKKDIYDPDNEFVDKEWLQTFLNLLKQSGVNISKRAAALHHYFPWIYPPLN